MTLAAPRTDGDTQDQSDRLLYDACPVCDGSAFAPSHRVDCSRHPDWRPPRPPIMTWMTCTACGHQFTDGYHPHAPAPDALDHARPSPEVERRRAECAALISLVTPVQNTGTWRAMGHADGAMLATAAEFGFTPCRAAPEGPCDDDGPPAAVISMELSLERVPFPKDALVAARHALVDNGILLITFQNAASYAWRHQTERGHNPYIGDLHRHHAFGRPNLSALLRATGFVPLRWSVTPHLRFGLTIVSRRST